MTLTEKVEVEEVLDRVDAPPWADAVDERQIDDDPEAALNHDRFRIADNGQADWAMRKLARTVTSQHEVDELAARQAEPIERWRRNEQARLDRERLFWEALLVEYHRGLVETDPKATSVRLPHGVLRSRQGQPQWQFTDDEFITWANTRGLDALVRVKFEVDKANAKEALNVADDGSVTTTDGEIAAGVSVAPAVRNFKVEPEVSK